MRSFSLVCVFALAISLAGCGGGSGGGSVGVTSAATGRAAFKIAWTKTVSKSRLVPLAAQSLKVTITSGGKTLQSQTVRRPDTGVSTIQFDGLPVGGLHAAASSFASSDATGTALSSGALDVTISNGQTTDAALTLDSTIDHINVDYKNTDVLPTDAPINVAATAYDASGAVVLLTPNALLWSSSDPNKISVSSTDTGALLTGVDAGTATITVTDSESNVSKNFDVLGMTFSVATAQGLNPIVSINDTLQLTPAISGPTNTDVTWSLVDANGAPLSSATTLTVGSVSKAGVFTASSTPGTYYVRATSAFDATRFVTTTLSVQSGSASLSIN